MRSLRRLTALAVLVAPLVAAIAVFAPTDANAGSPPGPWVFIPPPGTSSAHITPTAATTTATEPVAPVEDPAMAALRSTVVIERGKKPIALGVLLSERSVILTARSPIVVGPMTGDLEIRYPELGITVKAKLVHEDAAWDLALLVPASVKGAGGARPSDNDPLSPSATTSSYVLLKSGHLQAQATPVLGKRDYLSPEGEVLKDALSIDPKTLSIGTPIIDGGGGVVAMVGRACAPGTSKPATATPGKPPCTPSLYGVPMSVLKRFLRSAPATAKAPSAFLGVIGQPDKLGVKIAAVAPGSPAEAAGLKVGDPAGADVVLSVDGVLVRTPEELGEQIHKHTPGDVASLLVVRGTLVREAKVTLRAAEDPDDGSTKSAPTIAPSTVTPLPPLPLPPMPMPTFKAVPVPVSIPTGHAI